MLWISVAPPVIASGVGAQGRQGRQGQVATLADLDLPCFFPVKAMKK